MTRVQAKLSNQNLFAVKSGDKKILPKIKQIVLKKSNVSKTKVKKIA